MTDKEQSKECEHEGIPTEDGGLKCKKCPDGFSNPMAGFLKPKEQTTEEAFMKILDRRTEYDDSSDTMYFNKEVDFEKKCHVDNYEKFTEEILEFVKEREAIAAKEAVKLIPLPKEEISFEGCGDWRCSCIVCQRALIEQWKNNPTT